MKTTGILAFVGLASAHFTWDKISLNGVQVGGDNQYIRKHENYYLPMKFKNIPAGSISPADPGFVCNKNAKPAKDVLKVKANDMLGLDLGFGAKRMEHPGPVQFYVSPVGDAKKDTGSEWYKIHQALLCKQGGPETLRNDAWCMWGEGGLKAAIPETLPNGQYLVHAEQISLHGAHGGEAEFYVACAQIEVTGNTATTIPGTAVKMPLYKAEDKAVNFSVWGRSTSYDVIPGPEVIPGGTVRGSPNGAGGDKVVKVAGAAGAAAPATTPAATPAAGNNNNNNNGQQQQTPSTPAAASAPATSSKPSKPKCQKKRDVRARRAAMRASQQ